jgi:predicted amidohydrolase
MSKLSGSSLLEQAESEEEKFNWEKSAEIYENLLIELKTSNITNEIPNIIKKLGYVNGQAADTMITTERYVEHKNISIEYYKQANKLFKKLKDKAEEFECLAEAFYEEGCTSSSINEGETEFKNSLDYFKQANEVFFKRGDQKGYIRTLIRLATSINNLLKYSKNPKELEDLISMGINYAENAWKLSKKLNNNNYLIESFHAFLNLGLNNCFIEDIPTLDNQNTGKKLAFDFGKWFERTKSTYERTKEDINFRIKGKSHFFLGFFYIYYGFYLSSNIIEQEKNIEKGINLLEKALKCIKKTKDNGVLILITFYLNWFAFFGGKIKYVQKRIINDIQYIFEAGKVYSDLFSFWNFYSNFLPAIYYANIAQRSFFPPSQRQNYAKEAIKYAKSSIKNVAFEPFSVWGYQILSWSYSQLVNLASNEQNSSTYAEKMLENALQADKVARIYGKGLCRTSGYSALYRAYKTLADNAENKIEKIKMLRASIDSAIMYLNHPIESRTGLIGAKIRLGLLWEELGIISMEEQSLIKAKNVFLNVIEESLNKGYNSYAAASHEYIAHLEDRLGKYQISAEHYRKAQEAYQESLKFIEYNLLKSRILEKMSYSTAWKLIENAKAYHKKEDHSKAKENYEEANKILKDLSKYYYEAHYYFAWMLLEEAIEQYEKTKMSFYEAITILESTLNKTKEKLETERINKLIKVARVRMEYCSARINLEKARVLEKRGDNLAAAENFATAASIFKNLCGLFKIEIERIELKAIYFLCQAWETMALAENYEDAIRFEQASALFNDASMTFFDSKLKLLASGNCSFCKALELGCKFDKSLEIESKEELYPKVKLLLRDAASSYRKGGFVNGADWALATSTYFDATWHIIKSDMEMNLEEKRNLLELASKLLQSASELFEKAGYEHKQQEVLGRLESLKTEDKIIVSALNTIKKPSISSSTLGIIAPACSLETSSSSKLSEIRQIIEEEVKGAERKSIKKKYEIIYKDLLKKYPKIQRSEFRVGIAQIGMSETGDILDEYYEMKPSGLLNLRENKIENVRIKVKTMIEKANKEGIDVLLFPEMTIDLNYGELLKDISDLAKLYEMYIIPGSFHCLETKRNISRVFSKEGILWEQEKHIPAAIRYGETLIKEGIKVSEMPRKIVVCNTEFGRIAIVICRDFLDMDLRVELKNFEPPVDIILNPAFTPVTADFKAIHFDARRSLYAYCFFANVAEFGDSLIYTPEKDRTERIIPAKREDLIFKDVDIFRLRVERQKWEQKQKKEKDFIQSTR